MVFMGNKIWSFNFLHNVCESVFLCFNWVRTCNCVSHICSRSWYNNIPYVHYVLQVLGWLWTMCSIPTTVLWTSRILELVVLLCAAQVPTYPAVSLDHHQELTGTFLMEVGLNVMALHTTGLGLMHTCHLLEQYFSIVTLGLTQQGSSTATYLMTEEIYRAYL